MIRTLPKHIFRRGKGYYVRFNVPVEARTAVGKKQIVRSLGTSDLGEALVKRESVLNDIRETLYAEYDAKPPAILNRKLETTVRQTAHQWLSESDGINNSTRNRYSDQPHLSGPV